MVADLTKYYSHPDKNILDHVNGVVEIVKSLTDLNIAEIAAIFHDAGKLNPNFQEKLKPNSQSTPGYSNHAYLSAISFLYHEMSKEQPKNKKDKNDGVKWTASILSIIAHHHGNLPDFPFILNEDECLKLLSFIKEKPYLPISEFIKHYIPSTKDFTISEDKTKSFCNKTFQRKFHSINFKTTDSDCIDFFLKTRFAFASVIVADKLDAGNYQTQKSVQEFNNKYNANLHGYLREFHHDSDINKIRTKMREESICNLEKEIKNGSRIFSLTAPTGSGKTIMLLSIANEIIKTRKNLRIIYALPYLSITEQVESICRNIFKESNSIYRIDSKSNNSEPDKSDNIESVAKIIESQFAEDTFDYPFIITTFVRFFETLVTNKNAALLKFPNFANSIFLIDEIQSLPVRLYGFFVALLSEFCKKFNSYAVISTATMPNFELPENNKHDLNKIFNNYTKPIELLSLDYFNESAFNRYYIKRLLQPITIDNLANIIKDEESSVLVILNTIQDTKDLFSELDNKHVNAKIILINTHFTPHDRKIKIKESKYLLKNNKKVILISTQLVEAGVDIDFPIVYRDFCPIPNIVQSAGRCNRNGENNKTGKVVIFELLKNNRSRSALIYKDFLNFAKKEIQNCEIKESKLINTQQSFFSHIQRNTLFGVHYSKQFQNGEIDFVERIKENAFTEIGKFQLIDDKEFGEERRYYITENRNDFEFERLQNLCSKLKQVDFKDFQSRKFINIEIGNQLKKMTDNIVQVRLTKDDHPPLAEGEICLGLLKLSSEYYNKDTGICLTSENQIL